MNVAGPDLLVRIPRDPKMSLVFYRVICPTLGCNWSALVTVAQGGIVEVDGSVRFEKPVRCMKCEQDAQINQCAIGETGRVQGCCRSF